MNLSPTAKGMLLMVVATVSFTAMNSVTRIVASYPENPLHPLEVAFFRSLFGLLALMPMLIRAGAGSLKTRRLGMHAVRAMIQAVGMLCFFVAVTLIPLAEITALSFSAPLFATLLAVMLLGERIRRRRVSALGIGFLGVMVVLRPDIEVVSLGAGLALFSALTWAVAMIMIKSMSRTDSALTLTAYAGLFMTPITLVPALLVWDNPTLVQVGWLLCLGVFGSIGHLAFAQAFKVADMSAVLPLDFLRLVWASALGYLLFAEVPTSWSWAGGAMIFSAASYIAFREAQLGRAMLRREQDRIEGDSS